MRTGPWFGLWLTAALCCSLPLGAADAPPADFVRDILPDFPDRYYHDGLKSRSGCCLDMCPVALGGSSELKRRAPLARGVEALLPGTKMLTTEQVRLLRAAWVSAGASWPDAPAN